MATPELIDRANKVFEFGFAGPVLDFMGKQPVYPPSGSIRPGRVIKAPRGRTDVAPRANFVQFSKQKLENAADRIAFIKFVDDQSNTPHKGALSFDIKYGDDPSLSTVGSRAGYIPIWWLPWNGAGAVVKLKIEDANTATFPVGPGVAPIPNPKFFFTAAVNGCSVIIRGDDRGPSCYHAGIDGTTVKDAMGEDNFNALGGTVEQVWRNIIEGVYYRKSGQDTVLAPKPLAHHKGGQLKKDKDTWGEINRNDYVAERDPLNPDKYFTVPGSLPNQRMNTTLLAKTFQEFARNENRNLLTEIEVSPWGCVFGLRDGTGTWKMYLQRNSTITYRRLRKRHGVGKLRFGDLEPFGPQQTVFVTLAIQRFFPDKAAIHYREFSQVQLV